MNVKIYAAYHRLAPLLSSPSVVPLHVGRSNAAAPLNGMNGDNSGTHISDRNPTFCELTALYWAWKNDQTSDLIGLMHYRRLLDLTGQMPGGAVERTPERLNIPEWLADAESWIAREAADWDIIVPRLHEMGRTVEANYAAGHHAEDYDLVREIITRDHPEYLPSFEAVSAAHKVRLGNMMLMTRPVLDRYCTWLFDILFKVEATDIARRRYSPHQARYIGFLAERLLTVFVHHEMARNPSLRLREVSILNLAETLVTPHLASEQMDDPHAVNVACSADRAYLPHAAAMLQSLCAHADPARSINVFFLHSGLTPRDIGMLEEVTAGHARLTLYPIDTRGAFDGSYRSASRAPSNATYNRFLLLDLLPGLDRLIYLDVDVILRADICKLFDTDVGDAAIAAVPDWIMTRTLTGPVKTIDPGVPDLGIYHREVLELSDDQIARYFNAGVLLFNFAAFEDVAAESAALMREAFEGRYLFRDQDILNRHFRDRLHVLDGRWNVFNSPSAAYARVPSPNHARAMAARRDPWIIHYADRDNKPWFLNAVPLSSHYWQALIQTPFYGEVVGQAARTGSLTHRTSPIVRTGRALAERMPILKGPLLRIYAWLKGKPPRTR